MNTVWRFTDIEFVSLWEELREGALPRPFAFTARTPYLADYRRCKAAARERMRNKLGNGFGHVLTAIARPDIRVIAYGRHRSGDPAAVTRLLGVRRGEQAYLVSQLPGETFWHSGGYLVAQHEVLSLAWAVVDALPESQPGRFAEVPLEIQSGQRDDMDYRYGQRVAHEWSEDSVGNRVAKFLDSTVIRAGGIEVCQGASRFGPRGISRNRLDWRDLNDDGRYVINGNPPVSAVGVDEKKMVSLINSEIAIVVREIRDQRL